MMTIDEDKIAEVARTAEDFDLRLVLLFGSMTTGKSRPGSDIDIAVPFEKTRMCAESAD